MNTYKVYGVNSSEHAERIKGRFCDALGENTQVEIDLKNSNIRLPETIDSYTISLISSFEQISIVDTTFEIKEQEDGHNHEHAIGEGQDAQRNMLIVFLLNFLFSIGEFIFGTLFNSQAILSDAVHDLGDALSIGLAYFFEKVSNKGATDKYSYGYRRFSLLGAFVTSIVLIVGGILIIINTIPELINPQSVNHTGVFWMAIGAILINGFSVWLMSRGGSANEQLLNIHMLEDLVGWLAVLIMSIVLNFTNWYILDPILSIGIALWILYMTIPEFIRISKLFLQAVPDAVDSEVLRNRIKNLDYVEVISHFHLWSTDGEQHMMTLTVTTNSNDEKTQEHIKQRIRQIALEDNISHITIEILYDPNHLINDSITCGN